MKLGLERLKTLAELVQRLTVILGELIGRITTLETIDTDDIIFRLETIENNYLDSRVQFPLGFNTNCFYAVDASQSINDANSIIVDFADKSDNCPYITRLNAEDYQVNQDGFYFISTRILLGGITNSTFQRADLNLQINGADIERDRYQTPMVSSGSNSQFSLRACIVLRLELNDIITVQVFQDRSPNNIRVISTEDNLSNLRINYLGANVFN